MKIKNVIIIIILLSIGNLQLLSQVYDLTKSLPNGFVRNATIDYTAYLQKGINEHENVKMPDFPVLINSNGLKLTSNSKLIFQKKSSLILKPNDKEFYTILNITKVKNVMIENPRIVGDRSNHLGKKGEWGMGIYIDESQNIKIISAVITKCWGDGIYIGGNETSLNDNIVINNSKISDCRRNGISITHGSNITISDTEIANIQGTSPMSGIDIEPNDNSASIYNISFSNIITKNCESFGMLISLGQLPSNIAKKVDIIINNHTDYNSRTAFCLAGFREDYTNKKPLSGTIQVNGSKWYNNKISLLAGNYNFGPITKFINTKIFEKKNENPINEKDNVFISSQAKYQKMKREHKNYKNIIFE